MKWHANGLAIPASVTAASADYVDDNDDVALWIVECCDRQGEARAKASDLYDSFGHWIKSRWQHVPSMRLWGDRMAIVPGLTKVQSNGIRYVGIRLNDDEASRS